jgi:hypothetical protein
MQQGSTAAAWILAMHYYGSRIHSATGGSGWALGHGARNLFDNQRQLCIQNKVECVAKKLEGEWASDIQGRLALNVPSRLGSCDGLGWKLRM